nr:putative phage tail protein [uncultured Acetatifactor sp.]
MIREVDLVAYLPPFIAEYKETNVALTAENPEFALIWQAADQALKNEFIVTADGCGIARFERMLGIRPYERDTIEMRRTRLLSRWYNEIPYTMRMLALKLEQLFGGNHNFSLYPGFEGGYSLLVVVYSTDDSQVEELKYLLATMVPMNIVVDIVYEPVTSGLTVYGGGLMEQADILEMKQR